MKIKNASRAKLFQVGDSWEVIKSYGNPMEAHMAVSVLASNNIEAKVFDENAARLMPHMAPIIACRLAVRKSQANIAIELLEKLIVPQTEAEVAQQKSRSNVSSRARIVMIAIFLIMCVLVAYSIWNEMQR